VPRLYRQSFQAAARHAPPAWPLGITTVRCRPAAPGPAGGSRPGGGQPAVQGGAQLHDSAVTGIEVCGRAAV